MIPIISVLPKVTVSHVLFVTFKAALFLMNFNFIMFVVCSLMSKIFTMAIPDNSSTKVASIITIFCVFGAISTVVTGKNGIDLLRKLKHESLESITLSNSKMFFHSHNQIYIVMNFGYQSKNFKSMSMYMSIITGITKSMLTYCPFPT